MATNLTTGDRVSYLGGYRMDEPLLGTVVRTGWDLAGDWAEIDRDAFPDGPPCRLSIRNCQVSRLEAR